MDQSASFFDPSNLAAKKARESLAFQVLDDLLQWLRGCNRQGCSLTIAEGGDVAVFDATNTSDERRRGVLNYCLQNYGRKGIDVLFLESICDDPAVRAHSNLKLNCLRSSNLISTKR